MGGRGWHAARLALTWPNRLVRCYRFCCARAMGEWSPAINQQEEIGMEATVEAPSAQTRKDYTSRPGALSRFFRMSRDGWKSKYKDLKATVRGDKNRIADLTRSREQWRIRAERAVDRGSRGIRDQPRNPPKYTEKRIRINFPFPCPSRGQLPPVGWGRSVVTRLWRWSTDGASWGPFARAERLAPGRHHALSGEPPRCSSDNGLVPGPIRRARG